MLGTGQCAGSTWVSSEATELCLPHLRQSCAEQALQG